MWIKACRFYVKSLLQSLALLKADYKVMVFKRVLDYPVNTNVRLNWQYVS